MSKHTATLNWRQEHVSKRTRIKRSEGTYSYVMSHTLETTVQQLSGQVTIEIDLEQIINQIAYKAARNGSGRATQLNGLIKAKRITRNVLSETKRQFPIPEGYVEVAE